MKRDPEMRTLVESIRKHRIHQNDLKDLALYKDVFHELSVHGDVVLRGHKIVIPTSLYQMEVTLAHEGHQSIVKSKAYLRSIAWFPRMDQRVEDTVKSCHPCQVVTDMPIKGPLKMAPIPKEAWTDLRADFYGPVNPTGEMILVVEVEDSRYPDIDILNSTSS